MAWPTAEQPFGPNHAPLLAGIASDGSKDATGKFLAVPVAVDKTTGGLLVEVEVISGSLPNSFVNGQATVGVTAAALSSNSLTQGVIVQALSTNTASIFIGNSNAVTTSTGFELQPGQATSLAVNNTNLIYTISGSAAQGITFVGS